MMRALQQGKQKVGGTHTCGSNDKKSKDPDVDGANGDTKQEEADGHLDDGGG